jgi:hypothetical protein
MLPHLINRLMMTRRTDSNMRRLLPVSVALLVAFISPEIAHAQGVPLIVDAGTRVKSVEIERSRGNAVFNLESLEPLGAKVESDARGARLSARRAAEDLQHHRRLSVYLAIFQGR